MMAFCRRGGTVLLSLLALLLHPPKSDGAHQRSSAEFNEQLFRRKISSALTSVSRVLENTRSPQLAADHDDHTYDDKYSLAEFVTNSALAASVNALDRLGLDASKLSDLKSTAEQGKSVMLRFDVTETCNFIEEKAVEIESSHQYATFETTEKGEVKEEKTTRSKIVNEVKEQHWSFGVTYSIFAYAGTDPDDEDGRVVLRSRHGSTNIIVSGSKTRPRPEVYRPIAREVDITWFLKQLRLEGNDSASTSNFSIDRSLVGCHTPRRNDEVLDAETFFQSFRQWGELLGGYFIRELPSRVRFATRQKNTAEQPHDLYEVESMKDTLFVPVLPLFEGQGGAESDAITEPSHPLLSADDMKLFLNEQCRSMDKKIDELVLAYPSAASTELVSSDEASLALIVKHSASIAEHFIDGMDSIENMLRSQLTTAIGKDLKPSDFDDFLRFYYGRLFKEPYVPEHFVYAIRRPHHYPDGTVSIEGGESEYIGIGSGSAPSAEPIVTTTTKIEDDRPMFLPISAATKVEFAGDRYLHAWVRHDFSDPSSYSTVNLVARARQFSSFMLVTGTITGPDRFSPQDAIILQNKDEVMIPLLLEQLPTPKEFKDAIESLSPEQKRFAKAFRDMQLSTSVFGVLVIQLKPQLELCLGLPYNSLTKEIRLSQDLLSLFIEHQIPSDLLSYDGNEEAATEEKLVKVKAHVTALQEMIEDAKKRDLEDAKKKAGLEEEMKKQRVSRAQRGDMMADVEMEEEEVQASVLRSARRRMNHHADIMPRMMMAAVAADDIVYPAGEAFGEARLMGAAAGMEGSVHLRVHKEHATENLSSPDQPTPANQHTGSGSGPAKVNAVDFTQIPRQLDQKFEELDDAAALRPTKIKVGDVWKKKYHKSLLTPLETKSLGSGEQKAEREKAFDLLDALSKSGALPISYSELHVMVAATHRFDKSLIDTVIQDNVPLIEKVERSLLVVSSTINGLAVAELVSEGKAEEVASHSPALLELKENEGNTEAEQDTTRKI